MRESTPSRPSLPSTAHPPLTDRSANAPAGAASPTSPAAGPAWPQTSTHPQTAVRTPHSELGIALSILRRCRGWDQDRLASLSGVRNTSISDYEKGRKKPELATLERLLGAMRYPWSALDAASHFARLLRDSDTEHPQPDGAGDLLRCLGGLAESSGVPIATSPAATVVAQLAASLTLLIDLTVQRAMLGIGIPPPNSPGHQDTADPTLAVAPTERPSPATAPAEPVTTGPRRRSN